jgi:hypothetical protein
MRNNTVFWLENFEEREHLEDVSVNGNIILKLILEKLSVRVWNVGLFNWLQNIMTKFGLTFYQMKLGVTFGQMKFGVTFDDMELGVLFDQLSNYQIFKESYITWSWFMMEHLPTLFIKLS